LKFSESGSTLKKFLEESVSMSPEERAKFLENYDVSTFLLSNLIHGQFYRIVGSVQRFVLKP
jgi:hypothetical protein